MPVVGIIIQSANDKAIPSSNIAIITTSQLHVQEGYLISKKFTEYLSKYSLKDSEDKTYLEAGSCILFQYRITYELLHEVFIYTITEKSSNPFLGNKTLKTSKELLYSLCKGLEVTSLKLNRVIMELYSSLQKIIQKQSLLIESSSKLSFSQPISNSPMITKEEKIEDDKTDNIRARITELQKISVELPDNLFSAKAKLPPARPARSTTKPPAPPKRKNTPNTAR